MSGFEFGEEKGDLKGGDNQGRLDPSPFFMLLFSPPLSVDIVELRITFHR